MAGAARAADRSERSFFLFTFDSPEAMLRGPWGSRTVFPHDVQDLESADLLNLRSVHGSTREYTVAPAAYEMLEQIAMSNPIAQVEEDIVPRYLDSDAFRASYPQAYARW